MRKYLKYFIIIFSLILFSIILYVTLIRTSHRVTLSGVLRDKNGAIVSNKTIKIDGEDLSTDYDGQFIIHIKTNKKYFYEDKHLKFSIEYNQKTKSNNSTDNTIVMTGGITSSNTFVTEDKSLMMEMKEGTVHIDSKSDYSYSEEEGVLLLTTNLDLKKSDKIIIAPTYKSNGHSLQIEEVVTKGKKKKLKVKNSPIETTINRLEIHNNNLMKVTTGDTSISSPEPMRLSLKKEEEQSISLTKEIKLGDQDEDSISGTMTPNITGSLKEDVVFDFSNFNESYIKIVGSIGFKPTANVRYTAAKTEGEMKIFDIPMGTAVTHLLGKLQYDAGIDGKLELNYDYIPNFDFYWSPQNEAKKSKVNEAINKWSEKVSMNLNGEASIKLGPAITFADTDLFQLFVEGKTEGTISGVLKATSNSETITKAEGSLKTSLIVGGEVPIANKFGIKAKYNLLNQKLFEWDSSNNNHENNTNNDIKPENDIENAEGLSNKSIEMINDELAEWFSQSHYGKDRVIAKKGLSWYHGAGSPTIVDLNTEDGKMLQGVWWVGGTKISDITDEIASRCYPPKNRQQFIDEISKYSFSLLGISPKEKDNGFIYTTNGFSIYSLANGENGIIEDEQDYIWKHVPEEAQNEANATSYFYHNNIVNSSDNLAVYPATNGIVYFNDKNNYTEETTSPATRAPQDVQEEYQKLIRKYKN